MTSFDLTTRGEAVNLKIAEDRRSSCTSHMPRPSRGPLPASVRLLEALGYHAQALVAVKNETASIPLDPPQILTLELEIECDQIADVCVSALRSRCEFKCLQYCSC
jgi:hypothetical protein